MRIVNGVRNYWLIRIKYKNQQKLKKLKINQNSVYVSAILLVLNPEKQLKNQTKNPKKQSKPFHNPKQINKTQVKIPNKQQQHRSLSINKIPIKNNRNYHNKMNIRPQNKNHKNKSNK